MKADQIPEGHVEGVAAKAAGPCTMVIFGATGDLTKRLLVPAIYNLQNAKLLPENFSLLGISRSGESDEAFRDELDEFMKGLSKDHKTEFDADSVGGRSWKRILGCTHYFVGDFDDPETYKGLKGKLDELAKKYKTGGNVLFYLAVAPVFFSKIVKRLGEAGLVDQKEGWRRVIIEKPFGNDLKSARALNRDILKTLDESQIFRMDHFLGKETVQNIMALRFANGVFEPIWNRDHIDHVQISVTETVTVEKRGGFYESVGAMRDMVPNHLFQLLTLAAMEVPQSFEADAVRNEKVKLLKSIKPMTVKEVDINTVRGQYGAGDIGGRKVDDYRKADDVDPKSNTETYVAMKLMIDNWRWAGVPFYLRTGKSLAKRESEIAIRFKQAPFTMFPDTPIDKLAPNYMVLHIQPEEGISLMFNAKVPGPTVRMESVNMRFNYKDYFEQVPRTGYETLLYDCMMGEATLFQRADNVEAGWEVVQPILDHWAKVKEKDFPNYKAGSWGPKAADELLERDGRSWRTTNE
jgi:glucose-6-phosphate 1-dehydrogenase